MHTPNDNLQGILFDEQPTIDLRAYTVRQRFLHSVTATRLKLRERVRATQRTPKEPIQYYAFSAQNSKPEDLLVFNARLKKPNNED